MATINYYLFSKKINSIELEGSDVFQKIQLKEDDNTSISEVKEFSKNILIDSREKMNLVFDMIESMKSKWIINSEDSVINLFSNFNFVSDHMIELVSLIAERSSQIFGEVEEENDKGLNFYILSSSGDIFKINDFELIKNHLDIIEDSAKTNILKYDTLSDHLKERLKIDSIKALDSVFKKSDVFFNAILTEVRISILSLNLENTIFDEVKKNEEELDQATIDAINDTRDEESTEPTNEMEMVQQIFEEEVKDQNATIVSCKYNGEDIDPSELVSKLLSHVFPQFITQINIMDTKDDSYEITFSSGEKLVREKGIEFKIEK